jgi:acyl-CoA thioesterase-1
MKEKIIWVCSAVLVAGILWHFVGSSRYSPNPHRRTGVVVAFGDSLTAGYGVSESESYPALLTEELRTRGYRYTLVNKGVSGDTTADALKRLDEVIDEKPEVVILVLGGNDMLRNVPVGQTEANMRTLIERLQAEKVLVVLGGMRSIKLGSADRPAFNELYPRLAEEYDVPFIEYFLEGVALNSSLKIADQIHPNADGYRKIVSDHVLPVMKQVLRKDD